MARFILDVNSKNSYKMSDKKLWDYRVVRKEIHYPSDDNSVGGFDEV